MADAQDPTGTGAGSNPPASGSSTPPAGNSDGSVISRADHEAAIAQERKRQSGADRAYRKEIEELHKKIDNLANSGSRTPEPPDLPPLDPSSPYTAHLLHIYDNTEKWQKHVTERERAAEFRQRLSDAREEAISQGVPPDALDDSSPDAIAASAKEYLAEKRIRDLEDKLAQALKEKDTATAVARAEAGATSVSTATGGLTRPDPNLDEVKAEKQRLQKEKDRLSLRGGGPAEMVALRQVNKQIQAMDAREQELLAGSRR